MAHIVRVSLAVTLTLLAVSAGAARVTADSPRAVVRIYDTAVGHDTIRTAAIRAAAAILDDAGVALDLRDCTTAASSGGW
jgi:hypothetical protein